MSGRSSRARKGSTFSVRFSEPTERLVEAEAERLRWSKSAVVEAFTEETARLRRFPGLAFRGEGARRRAWVVGSGLDVWEIVQMAEDFGSPERLLAETQITTPQLRLALAYRGEYPEEIAEQVEQNRRPVEELRSLYPFIQTAESQPG